MIQTGAETFVSSPLRKECTFMDIYQTVNDVLVHLFYQIMDLEENAIITDEYKDLSVNDMHIIEAIGLGEGSNMSTIAKRMDITVGSLTTSMNSIVNKGYAVRERSQTDRRVVMIQLTEKGEQAYNHHANFHASMTEAVVKKIRPEEMPMLVDMLNNLTVFFNSYHEHTK